MEALAEQQLPHVRLSRLAVELVKHLPGLDVVDQDGPGFTEPFRPAGATVEAARSCMASLKEVTSTSKAKSPSSDPVAKILRARGTLQLNELHGQMHGLASALDLSSRPVARVVDACGEQIQGPEAARVREASKVEANDVVCVATQGDDNLPLRSVGSCHQPIQGCKCNPVKTRKKTMKQFVQERWLRFRVIIFPMTSMERRFPHSKSTRILALDALSCFPTTLRCPCRPLQMGGLRKPATQNMLEAPRRPSCRACQKLAFSLETSTLQRKPP